MIQSGLDRNTVVGVHRIEYSNRVTHNLKSQPATAASTRSVHLPKTSSSSCLDYFFPHLAIIIVRPRWMVGGAHAVQQEEQLEKKKFFFVIIKPPSTIIRFSIVFRLMRKLKRILWFHGYSSACTCNFASASAVPLVMLGIILKNNLNLKLENKFGCADKSVAHIFII